MRKKFLSLCLLILTTYSYGQTSIWKVSNEQYELYLGGSVHLLREADYPIPQEYDQAIKDSEIFVFETDIAALENPHNGQKMMQKAMLEGDKTLKTVLSEDTFLALEKEVTKMGLPMANLLKFKPGMLITTMTALKVQAMGAMKPGVDKYVFEKVLENESKTDFLETVDEQIDLITQMGEGNEDEYVRYSLEEMVDFESSLNKMIGYWKTGNIKEFETVLTEFKTKFPQTYTSLLVTRNNNWMEDIEAYLKNPEKEFVVVGALHLFGEEGLLNQLKAKGYQISRFQLN